MLKEKSIVQASFLFANEVEEESDYFKSFKRREKRNIILDFFSADEVFIWELLGRAISEVFEWEEVRGRGYVNMSKIRYTYWRNICIKCIEQGNFKIRVRWDSRGQWFRQINYYWLLLWGYVYILLYFAKNEHVTQ